MDNLILIACVGKNNELGKDNDLIWTFKEDMQFFRQQTMGKNIVMGYNTFKSLPGILKNRKHIILTHRNIEKNENIEVYHTLEELLKRLDEINEDIYVIGGATIYKQLLPYSTEIILTEVNQTQKADVYFPDFDKSKYNQELLGDYKEYKRVRYRVK